MSKPSAVSVAVKKINASHSLEATDALAVEEPLEIRLIHGAFSERKMNSISVTMRTPGADDELAAGFLFTEGIIRSAEQVLEIFNNPEDCANRQENIITVALKEDVIVDLHQLERHFYTTSSCGVCGKASIEAIRTVREAPEPGENDFTVLYETLYSLPELLNRQQAIFQSTGGLHASAIFDHDCNLLAIREDVGRHNALDKLTGYFLLNGGLPLDRHILLLSGRASFELIQKAVSAGIKIVCAVGAPSSLAVELAREFNITLIGFLREKRFNIYSGAERILL